MEDLMTEEEFAGKIEWEGGVLEALSYGLKWESCEPGELRTMWKSLQAAYDGIHPLLQNVYEYFDGIFDE